MKEELFCRSCGEEFERADYDALEFVSCSTFSYGDVKEGFVEYRRCSRCSHDVIRRVEYAKDEEPATERNPVPTMRPPEVA